MIKVFLPYDHKEERRYTVNQFFQRFCGYETSVDHHNEPFTLVVCENGSRLKLYDYFFSRINSNFPNESFLPYKLEWLDVALKDEIYHMPILYGKNEIENLGKDINLYADILASVFFMLTRWEEAIPQVLDKHGRFPLTSNWTYKHNIHQIAIVDRYVHFVRGIINQLDPQERHRQDSLQITPSHDMDYLQKWKGIGSFGSAIKKACIEEKSILSTKRYAYQFFNNINPFNNVSDLMDLAEAQGLKTNFYFLPKGDNKRYDRSDFDDYPKIAERMKSEILERGHDIGLHGSYESFNDINLLVKEKRLLENWLGSEVQKIRQHYLRFSSIDTWPIQDEIGFKLDATLGFSEAPGFRSGTSRTYKAYDLLQKKPLNLMVSPLIMMDTSYLNEVSKNFNEHIKEIHSIREEIKNFGVNWHFLIHNSSFFWERDLQYSELWKSFYREINE